MHLALGRKPTAYLCLFQHLLTHTFVWDAHVLLEGSCIRRPDAMCLNAITGSAKERSACYVAHLGTGSNLGPLFLVMLGLMAFRALMGASALAAVPIWVASDAYYSSTRSTQSIFSSGKPVVTAVQEAS